MKSTASGIFFTENSETFKILSNPVRLHILTLLQQNELSIPEIHILIQNVSQSAISKHLTLLKIHGFIKVERRGPHVFYKLSQEKLMSIVFNFKKIFNMEENNV
ncbi:MAG: ArsR/SmtB family transcription factor [Fusobacteriaceae bacterium]